MHVPHAALATATGVTLGNSKLHILVAMGDGTTSCECIITIPLT